MTVGFLYHFHPVRQGLFASGCLYEANEPVPRFLWVYDCGTVSKGVFWSVQLGELKRFANGKSEIDLLTISHFDKDHISGIVPLLKRFSVRALLLPYVPLWQRLVLAFKDGVGPGDDSMGFYLDPVAYLRGIEGAKIDRVNQARKGMRLRQSI